ncbi:MAG: hypothetical protein ACFFDT_11665, partial [Candidatus Hodarchaeota archaeon]
VDKLEEKYAKRLDRLVKKLRKLGRELTMEEAEYKARKREEMAGAGGAALSFFLGRRSPSSITGIARRRRMTTKAKMRVEETKEEITELNKEMTDLENELKEGIDEITRKWDEAMDDLITEEIRPRRTDVNVQLTALAWAPSWHITYNDGKVSQIRVFPAYSYSDNE